MAERVAIISDVHGNAEAFEAVLGDIHARGIEEILNLGDVIGYGPDPERCLDLAMERCAVVLRGNHEYAVQHDAEGFNPVAKRAIDFSKDRLDPDLAPEDEARRRRWQFISTLQAECRCNGYAAMHGSPRHPVMEYVLPSDPETDPLKVDDIFDCMSADLVFVGHTHFPGVVEQGQEAFLIVEAADASYQPAAGCKAVVNVGSVGQPRDHDFRACWVEYDGQTVWYRRVPYDVEATIRKINAQEALHETLGLRLRQGR